MYKATSKYFPIRIESVAEIPNSYKKYFPKLDEEKGFPYCIYVPGDGVDGNYKSSWLLVLTDSVFNVIEDMGNTVSIKEIQFKDVFLIERGCALLYSWLDVKAQSENKMVSVHVEFNTVREDLFMPIVMRLRGHYCGIEDHVEENQEKLAFLKEENPRFINYAEHCLMPICNIKNAIFQPEIQKPFIKRPRDNNYESHLTLVCTEELIDITETRLETANSPSSVGAIWRYIPLKAIKSKTVDANEIDHTIQLVLELGSKDLETLIYEDAIKERIDRLIT